MKRQSLEGLTGVMFHMDETKRREKDFHDRRFSENDGERKGVGRFYALSRRIDRDYGRLLGSVATGSRVLELGCAGGGWSLELAARGADVDGIDISEVAIDNAARRAAADGLSNARFRVMDAEDLDFGDGVFDIVFGRGILHHLDLERVCGELARVLRPGGTAVFIEPLGHNPLINLFRRMTPGIRTADEHPLMGDDLHIMRTMFGDVEMRYYYMVAIGAALFHRTPLFGPALTLLDAVDRALFALMPPLRRYAWMTLVVMRKA